MNFSIKKRRLYIVCYIKNVTHLTKGYARHDPPHIHRGNPKLLFSRERHHVAPVGDVDVKS
jgi:hypothetical protein